MQPPAHGSPTPEHFSSSLHFWWLAMLRCSKDYWWICQQGGRCADPRLVRIWEQFGDIHAPGGVLATYTCSHHMQDAELRSVLAEAAADARRRVQVLEFCHQPPDHPVLLTMPESEYLRGYIVRVE